MFCVLQSHEGCDARHPGCVTQEQRHMDSLMRLFNQVKPVDLGTGKLLAPGAHWFSGLFITWEKSGSNGRSWLIPNQYLVQKYGV